MQKRLFMILLFTLIMGGWVFVVGFSLLSGETPAYVNIKPTMQTPSIPVESGVFRRDELALDYLNMPDDPMHQRSLYAYYKTRAYHGAPPIISHPIEVGDGNIGGKKCLQCHDNGGFVAKLNAYAPVTPHPEMLNCRQCHLPQNVKGLFKLTDWENNAIPNLEKPPIPHAPVVMPHGLQFKENCLACHAGSAAPKEIRTPHPQWSNCRQCHVENDKFTGAIKAFKKSNPQKK
ncbi:MAG: hypothetical protein MI784_00375 [Cytophagales bacterium]|nr:hypothetical protein [Cytophagales bacterium]